MEECKKFSISLPIGTWNGRRQEKRGNAGEKANSLQRWWSVVGSSVHSSGWVAWQVECNACQMPVNVVLN